MTALGQALGWLAVVLLSAAFIVEIARGEPGRPVPNGWVLPLAQAIAAAAVLAHGILVHDPTIALLALVWLAMCVRGAWRARSMRVVPDAHGDRRGARRKVNARPRLRLLRGGLADADQGHRTGGTRAGPEPKRH